MQLTVDLLCVSKLMGHLSTIDEHILACIFSHKSHFTRPLAYNDTSCIGKHTKMIINMILIYDIDYQCN